MDACTDAGLNVYQLVRILIRKPCRGYYIRWWYNGWHYWYFRLGRISYHTEGQEYRTLGTNGVEISSGQVPETLVNGIKTIAWSRSIYLLNDNGWANVMIHPSRNTVKNNYIDGYELFFILKIGSASVARLTYTPPDSQWISFTPQLGWTPAAIFAVDKHDLDFTFSEYGSSYALVVNVQSPSQDFAVTLYDLSWAMVINSITKITVYPLSQNTGAARNGVIELSLPGYSPQYIAVTQYQYLASQVFESDKTYMDFIWDYYGIGIANYATLNVAPDQIITYSKDVTWLAVSINQVSKVVTIYPTGKNDSVQRSGTVSLHCPDASDIDVTVVHFAIPAPDAPVIGGAEIFQDSLGLSWAASATADGYYLDVATDVGFTSMVAGYNNLNVGAGIYKLITGLDSETDYWVRLRAYNDSGTSGNSASEKFTTGVAYSVNLSLNVMFFDYLKVACSTDTITVTSSNNWTAELTSGTEYFSIDKTDGATGETITITCIWENDEPNDHSGLLRVTCGDQSEDCAITQYKVLESCP